MTTINPITRPNNDIIWAIRPKPAIRRLKISGLSSATLMAARRLNIAFLPAKKAFKGYISITAKGLSV
jgi:hypothetical protein